MNNITKAERSTVKFFDGLEVDGYRTSFQKTVDTLHTIVYSVYIHKHREDTTMHQAIHPITIDEYLDWFIALLADDEVPEPEEPETDPNRIPDEDDAF